MGIKVQNEVMTDEWYNLCYGNGQRGIMQVQ